MTEGDYDKVLRKAADDFVMTVAVVAEHEGRHPAEVSVVALADALARLTETGVLGGEERDE